MQFFNIQSRQIPVNSTMQISKRRGKYVSTGEELQGGELLRRLEEIPEDNSEDIKGIRYFNSNKYWVFRNHEETMSVVKTKFFGIRQGLININGN